MWHQYISFITMYITRYALVIYKSKCPIHKITVGSREAAVGLLFLSIYSHILGYYYYEKLDNSNDENIVQALHKYSLKSFDYF